MTLPCDYSAFVWVVGVLPSDQGELGLCKMCFAAMEAWFSVQTSTHASKVSHVYLLFFGPHTLQDNVYCITSFVMGN